MSSIVEICNLALLHIRDSNLINSLTDGSVEAHACNTVYETSKKTVLEAQSWRFATTTAELSPLSEGQEKTYPYKYSYALPSDLIRINDIINYSNYYNYTLSHKHIPYETRISTDQTRKILLTDEQTPILKYNIDVTNSQLFSSVFGSALSWYIAFEIAPILTNDEKLRQLCFDAYQQMLQVTSAIDNNQDNNINLKTNYYVAQR